MEETKMLCERCRQFFPVAEIKYMPKGTEAKTALCARCRELHVKEKTQMPKDSREAFFCVRCRYKFKAKDGITKALKCPFCGKTDKIIQDKKETSDNLINDTAIKFVQNQEPEEKPGFKLLKIKRKN